MDGSIHLKPSERKTLLEYYRKSADPNHSAQGSLSASNHSRIVSLRARGWILEAWKIVDLDHSGYFQKWKCFFLSPIWRMHLIIETVGWLHQRSKVVLQLGSRQGAAGSHAVMHCHSTVDPDSEKDWISLDVMDIGPTLPNRQPLLLGSLGVGSCTPVREVGLQQAQHRGYIRFAPWPW